MYQWEEKITPLRLRERTVARVAHTVNLETGVAPGTPLGPVARTTRARRCHAVGTQTCVRDARGCVLGGIDAHPPSGVATRWLAPGPVGLGVCHVTSCIQHNIHESHEEPLVAV